LSKSSKLPSSAAISLNNLPPNTSVAEAKAAIFPFRLSISFTPRARKKAQIMAPLVETFPADELPYRTQINAKGHVRKGFNGDLKGCELMEMVQYMCEVEEPRTRESVTRCWPVQRWFRRCQDRDGTFMVETTAWEGKKAR